VSVKRVVIGLGLAVVLGFLAIQLVPYGHSHINPPVLSEPAWDSAATRATAGGDLLRLPQQPDGLAVVFERRTDVVADPA
jgi:hypothetical protein